MQLAGARGASGRAGRSADAGWTIGFVSRARRPQLMRGSLGGRQGSHMPNVFYAVVMRDSSERRLLCRLKRSAAGDVYFLIPGEDRKANRHVSYHKSGQRHVKSYRWEHFVSHLQGPDQYFCGAEALFAMAIPPGQASQYPVLSPAERFDAYFEIDASQIPETEHHTLTADLVEPGIDALPGPWKDIVAQQRFDDAIPGILVTLWRGLRV